MSDVRNLRFGVCDVCLKPICQCPKPKVPHAMTREQVEVICLDFIDDLPTIKQRSAIVQLSSSDAALRRTLTQQAQEVERLKVDAQLGRDLCAILQNHVGETGLTEGAVEVLKRKLQQLAGAERERDAAVSVCDDFKRGFGEARQQLAAMAAEREKAWTRDRPLVPGFYGFMPDGREPRIVRVTDKTIGSLYGVGAQWCGPIVLPPVEDAGR